MKLIKLSLALLLASSAPLWADRVQVDREDVFFLDIDGDGAISEAEFAEFSDFAFSTIDTDSSGALSLPEVEVHLTSDDFSVMDANDDGSISKTEWASQLNGDFAAADKNQNGLLD